MLGSLLEQFEVSVHTACRSQNRYRTLILMGKPQCGKSTLLKSFSKKANWEYINYTQSNDFFGSITQIEAYTPKNLARDIMDYLKEYVASDIDSKNSKGVIFDELEAIFAVWTRDDLLRFISQITSQTQLACGLVLSTRLFSNTPLPKPYIKNSNQIFVLGE